MPVRALEDAFFPVFKKGLGSIQTVAFIWVCLPKPPTPIRIFWGWAAEVQELGRLDLGGLVSRAPF